MLNLNERPDRLILKVIPGADGSTSLYEDEGDTEGYKQGAYTTTLMEQRQVSDGVSLILNPISGQFNGMPQQRAYTVEFLARQKPQQVLVNGKPQANGVWNYDEQRQVVTVYVPSTPCTQKTTVQLRNR